MTIIRLIPYDQPWPVGRVYKFRIRLDDTGESIVESFHTYKTKTLARNAGQRFVNNLIETANYEH